jgi:hypothetical protein
MRLCFFYQYFQWRKAIRRLCYRLTDKSWSSFENSDDFLYNKASDSSSSALLAGFSDLLYSERLLDLEDYQKGFWPS